MLFYLTDSLIVDKTAAEFLPIKRAIRHIAMAVSECKHLLRGDESVLKYYEKEYTSDEDIFGLIHHLVVNSYTANSVPMEICNYVEVINGTPTDTVRDCHKIKQVSYTYFDDSIKVQAMRIAVEDIDDSKFYDYILNWYLTENALKFNHMFQVVPGSGSRTDVVVRDNLNNGLMITCIADSDKKYPTQPDDKTKTGYKCSLIKCPKGGIYYFHMLNTHELENLIPLNHYNVLKWQGQSQKDKNDFAHLCGKSQSEYILRYFDIKEGLKKSEISELGPDFAAFAELCCSLHPTILNGMKFKDYVDSLPCDESYVYPRLISRPMKELASMYENGNLPYPSLMVFQFDEWNRIGRLLLDVTCSKNPERSM